MIKTIIFDWGGVLTVGKYTLSVLKTLSKETKISIEKYYSDFDKLIVEMNEDRLSFTNFVRSVNNKFGLKITEKGMKEIFRKSIIPNKEVIQLAENLSRKYNLTLMSDIDEVTVENLKEYHKSLLETFSKKYFSYKVKMRKPNLNFFKYVLNDSGLEPSKCLFIDDKQKNVDAAISCGMKALVFSDIFKLKKELASLGIHI